MVSGHERRLYEGFYNMDLLEKTKFCKHTFSAKDYILVLLILDTTSQLLESLLYLHKLNLKGSEAPVILISLFCSNK